MTARGNHLLAHTIHTCLVTIAFKTRKLTGLLDRDWGSLTDFPSQILRFAI